MITVAEKASDVRGVQSVVVIKREGQRVQFRLTDGSILAVTIDKAREGFCGLHLSIQEPNLFVAVLGAVAQGPEWYPEGSPT